MNGIDTVTPISLKEAPKSGEQKEATGKDQVTQVIERLQTEARDLYQQVIKDGPNVFDRAVKSILDGLKPNPAPGGDKTPHSQWTLAINLNTKWSDEDRVKELEKIVDQTKGKDVTIVVQVAVPDKESEKDKKTDSSTTDGKKLSSVTGFDHDIPDLHDPFDTIDFGVGDGIDFSPNPKSYHLERYIIRDGKMEKVGGPIKSTSYAADVEDFLKFANKSAPSDKLGLVLDSHGSGNPGFTSDVGEAKTREVKDAIKKGLAGSGHDKLDMLDFDCCLMGQNGVMREMGEVAKHVVASTETEPTAGQILIPSIQHLLKNPKMDGRDLSTDVIKEQKSPEIKKPLDTLGYYNMEKYPQFKESLDTVGDTLSKLLENPENRKVIEKIIDSTKTYGSHGLNFDFHFELLFPHPFGHFGGIDDFDGGFGGFGGGGFGFPGINGGVPMPDMPAPPHSSSGIPEIPGIPAIPGLPDFGGLGGHSFEDMLLHEMLPTFPPPHELPLPVEHPGKSLGGGSKYDLKDFLEKVSKAIDDKELKDPDGSIKKAVNDALAQQKLLVESYYGKGDFSKYGGLSVFLPGKDLREAKKEKADKAYKEELVDDNGGWAKFRNRLRH